MFVVAIKQVNTSKVVIRANNARDAQVATSRDLLAAELLQSMRATIAADSALKVAETLRQFGKEMQLVMHPEVHAVEGDELGHHPARRVGRVSRDRH